MFGDLAAEPGYSLGYTGTTTVQAGELVFAGKAAGNLANIPSDISDYIINAGGTLTFNIDADVTATPGISGDLSGAGTFHKEGAGALEIRNAQDGFTGSILVSAGDLSLTVANAVANSTNLEVKAAGRVLLNDNDQVFQSLSGETGAELILGSANVTFNTASGAAQIYAGTISGTGDIVKNGPGTLVLHGDNTGIYSGTVTVNAGVLEVTTVALGSGDVTVNNAGTLRFYSDNTTGVDEYAKAIGGIGTIAKTAPARCI